MSLNHLSNQLKVENETKTIVKYIQKLFQQFIPGCNIRVIEGKKF